MRSPANLEAVGYGWGTTTQCYIHTSCRVSLFKDIEDLNMSFPGLGSIQNIPWDTPWSLLFSNDFQLLQLIHKLQSYRKKTDTAPVSHASYSTQSLSMYELPLKTGPSSFISNQKYGNQISSVTPMSQHNCKLSIAVVSFFLLQLVWSVHFRLLPIYLSTIKIKRFQGYHR